MTGGDHRIHKMGARCGGGPEDWRKASVTFIDRKGKKEEAGNYGPVSLTSISGKATGAAMFVAAIGRWVSKQCDN